MGWWTTTTTSRSRRWWSRGAVLCSVRRGVFFSPFSLAFRCPCVIRCSGGVVLCLTRENEGSGKLTNTVVS